MKYRLLTLLDRKCKKHICYQKVNSDSSRYTYVLRSNLENYDKILEIIGIIFNYDIFGILKYFISEFFYICKSQLKKNRLLKNNGRGWKDSPEVKSIYCS